MSYDIDVYTPRGMPYIRNEQDTYIEDVSRRRSRRNKSYKNLLGRIYFSVAGILSVVAELSPESEPLPEIVVCSNCLDRSSEHGYHAR